LLYLYSLINEGSSFTGLNVNATSDYLCNSFFPWVTSGVLLVFGSKNVKSAAWFKSSPLLT